MVITMSMMTCFLTALLCIEYVEECVSILCTEECHFSQCAVQTEPGHWEHNRISNHATTHTLPHYYT